MALGETFKAAFLKLNPAIQSSVTFPALSSFRKTLVPVSRKTAKRIASRDRSTIEVLKKV